LFEIIEQPHQFLALFVYLSIRDTASLIAVQFDSDLLFVATVNEVGIERQQHCNLELGRVSRMY
jgi:hypothetical protein